MFGFCQKSHNNGFGAVKFSDKFQSGGQKRLRIEAGGRFFFRVVSGVKKHDFRKFSLVASPQAYPISLLMPAALKPADQISHFFAMASKNQKQFHAALAAFKL